MRRVMRLWGSWAKNRGNRTKYPPKSLGFRALSGKSTPVSHQNARLKTLKAETPTAGMQVLGGEVLELGVGLCVPGPVVGAPD